MNAAPPEVFLRKSAVRILSSYYLPTDPAGTTGACNEPYLADASNAGRAGNLRGIQHPLGSRGWPSPDDSMRNKREYLDSVVCEQVLSATQRVRLHIATESSASEGKPAIEDDSKDHSRAARHFETGPSGTGTSTVAQ
jgi:single-stranded DNA-binding protein